MKMWCNGKERSIPRDADIKPSRPGTYRGKRGSWSRVSVKGKWVGTTFVEGPVFEGAARRLHIISDIEPFRNIAIDRDQIIGGRRQKREMMRETGLIEAGDIKQGDIKPAYDERAHKASVVHSLKQALHQHGMGD